MHEELINKITNSYEKDNNDSPEYKMMYKLSESLSMFAKIINDDSTDEYIKFIESRLKKIYNINNMSIGEAFMLKQKGE